MQCAARTLTIGLLASSMLGWLSACATSHDAAATGAAATAATKPTRTAGGGPYTGDVDGEEDRHGRDADDSEVFGFGQPATNLDAGAITALVKRYYAAGAARNGAAACSLLYSAMAESVVEDYSRLLFGSDAHGKTCGAVMSRYFGRRHRQLAGEDAVLRVTQVRTKGNQGLALLDLGGEPERHILLRREFGVWKVGTLLDIGMP